MKTSWATADCWNASSPRAMARQSWRAAASRYTTRHVWWTQKTPRRNRSWLILWHIAWSQLCRNSTIDYLRIGVKNFLRINQNFRRIKKALLRASRKIKTTGAEGRNQRKKERRKEGRKEDRKEVTNKQTSKQGSEEEKNEGNEANKQGWQGGRKEKTKAKKPENEENEKGLHNPRHNSVFHHNKIVACVFALPLFLLFAWAFVPSTTIQCPAAILKRHWNVLHASTMPAMDPVHPGERRCALPLNPSSFETSKLQTLLFLVFLLFFWLFLHFDPFSLNLIYIFVMRGNVLFDYFLMCFFLMRGKFFGDTLLDYLIVCGCVWHILKYISLLLTHGVCILDMRWV